jgi:hypothetical protein
MGTRPLADNIEPMFGVSSVSSCNTPVSLLRDMGRVYARLSFPDDTSSLQQQWKRIRDRYVRERKKRHSNLLHNNDANHNSSVRRFLRPRRLSILILGVSRSPRIGRLIAERRSGERGERHQSTL